MRTLRSIICSSALIAGAMFMVGCASNDNVDNVSERPWNDTTGWQGGLPSGLNEGR